MRIHRAGGGERDGLLRRLCYAAALLSPAVVAVLAASPAGAAAKRAVEVRGPLAAALKAEIVQASAKYDYEAELSALNYQVGQLH